MLMRYFKVENSAELKKKKPVDSENRILSHKEYLNINLFNSWCRRHTDTIMCLQHNFKHYYNNKHYTLFNFILFQRPSFCLW